MLFAPLSAVTKTFLQGNFSIFFFKDWTEWQLVCDYLYKCVFCKIVYSNFDDI